MSFAHPRRRSFGAILAGALFAAGLLAPTVAAQEPVADRLPEAAVFGSGWTQIATLSAALALPADADLDVSFEDAAHGVYGGPGGARVVVSVLRVTEGLSAGRQSWLVADTLFDSYRADIERGFLVGREAELGVLPLPEGCAEARRLYGTDTIGFQQFPVGLTLCAVDPDLFVFVYTSGEVNGLTANDAADFVVAATIGGGADGTPVAGA